MEAGRQRGSVTKTDVEQRGVKPKPSSMQVEKVSSPRKCSKITCKMPNERAFSPQRREAGEREESACLQEHHRGGEEEAPACLPASTPA